MKLVFCLGNPTPAYEGTRHNVGFLVADAVATSHAVNFVEKSKLKALVAELTVDGEKIIVAKPITYYNDVGQSYRAIVDFYKLAVNDVLIVHDELMLPFGTLRSRVGGSDAGNNGVKSINHHGGSQTYRLRIGVGNELRDRMDDSDFVLGKFSANEREKLKEISDQALSIIAAFINNSFDITSHTII